MRISFVGGGTDLPAFYRQSPGRVISVAIDKYVYVAINPTPHIGKVSARYSLYEQVEHPRELRNNRMREALIDLGIHSSIEISTFSHVPEKTGLGSSSSFSVALMKALYTYLGKKVSPVEAAAHACRLEIDLLGEPIGKQDQYASALGGLNVLQFNPDESVDTMPLFLDYQHLDLFKKHLLLFFTGITRDASSVLLEQNKNSPQNIDSLKAMAEKPFEFRKYILEKNFKKLGDILHENWILKKGLASNISNSSIDTLYSTALSMGAYGGKILGAGNGGCFLFLVPPEKTEGLRSALPLAALSLGLTDFREIPFRFVQSGVELVVNHSSQAHCV